jgi:3-oxoacyl-[acyl-carrier protein] reductase
MAGRVLITGASKKQGIGYEAISLFLDKGYEVIVIGRRFDDFEYKGNSKVQTIVYDLSDLNGIPQLVQQIGEIDILVNNAGFNNFTHFSDYTEEKKEKILKVNLEAPVAFITEFAKVFEKRGGGRIVNVSSKCAKTGNRDIWYGITKAGLSNATRSFAALLAEKGVIINAVAPGVVDTQWLKSSPYQDMYEKSAELAYSRRLCKPKEVAQLIVWLATESPEYINGETIDINGGSLYLR